MLYGTCESDDSEDDIVKSDKLPNLEQSFNHNKETSLTVEAEILNENVIIPQNFIKEDIYQEKYTLQRELSSDMPNDYYSPAELAIINTKVDSQPECLTKNVNTEEYSSLKKLNSDEFPSVNTKDNKNSLKLNEVDFKEEKPNFDTELKSKISKRTLKHIPKLTIENNEIPMKPTNDPYKGVSDRIQTLIKCNSLNCNNSPAPKNKENPSKDFIVNNETRKLSIDSDREKKKKEFQRQFSINTNFGVCCHSTDIDLSNSEIISEDFSTVSETTKQLEQQLSFTSCPRSPALSPRIPKLTRFARLNRLLSATTDPEDSEENPIK